MMLRILIILVWALTPVLAFAQSEGDAILVETDTSVSTKTAVDDRPACSTGTRGAVRCIADDTFVADTCGALNYFATHNNLDPGFFARLIWQESRFNPNALSPANARGIAQFIDSTAALRGLKDSYNPAQALEFSAHYLGELVQRYGNSGLAAVAYNGGERRADGLVAKTAGLARETVDYVQIITGLTAEDWRDDPPMDHDFRLQGDMPFAAACADMAKNRAYTKYPPPIPNHAPWGVRLAFGTSESASQRAFDTNTRSCKSLVDQQKLEFVFVRNRVSGRNGYYMAQLAADTSAQANAVCRTLRARGCICAAYRNK